MNGPFDDPNAAWRRCEQAWARHLESSHDLVTLLSELNGRFPGYRAPVIKIGGRACRAPDIEAKSGGQSSYYEVKFRRAPSFDPLSGEAEHWMSHSAFHDYQSVARSSKCNLTVVLYEAPTAVSPGRWLKIGLNRLRVSGHRGQRRSSDGSIVEAWIWPRSSMTIIDGPSVPLSGASVLALPDEGESPDCESDDWVDVETLLNMSRAGLDTVPPRPRLTSGPANTIEEWAAALKVISDRLGLPHVPRYSVLRVGIEGVDLDELLELVTFGIRVFVVAGTIPVNIEQSPELRPFLEARLLEVAEVSNAECAARWIIDGRGINGDTALESVLERADAHGGINVLQYRIVHEVPDADVQVVAGAGTGKTETMTERIMYLLTTSTSDLAGIPGGESVPSDLRLDDIVLVTFTKEAAKQMRERIARVLMLRQRLCRRNVMPTLAWMMQLGSTQVSTIHSYAKQIARQSAAIIGFGPSVAVSQLTLEFREALHRAISGPFTAAVARFGPATPPIHEWVMHALEVWSTMDNAGVSMLDLRSPNPAALDVNWGSPRPGTIDEAIAVALPDVFRQVSVDFSTLCRSRQSIPTSQLVTVALQCLESEDSPMVRRPRHLFVDEFQDTDEQQMDFILAVREKLGARLFVVGDVKQGIYRFRGAQGNAFIQLEAKWHRMQLPPVVVHHLVRNFRSGGLLLESMDPYFEAWGQGTAEARLLEYLVGDKLVPARHKVGRAAPLNLRTINRSTFAEQAAEQAITWRGSEERRSPDSIAILCRYNSHAREVQKAIRSHGYSCDLAAKGSFYQSPAVLEMRALLEAVNNSGDDAALLELAETRWANGVLNGTQPFGVEDSGDADDPWAETVGGLVPWRERWRTLPDGSFLRDDLDLMRARVSSLRTMLGSMALLGWLTVLVGHFAPQNVALSPHEDRAELNRYARCLTHLMSCLDEEFGNAPITLSEALLWLALQIATNENEDEPFDEDDTEGTTVAITVHKAKGLEFSRVLIPNTWMPWGVPPKARTMATLLRGQERPAIVWRWKGLGGNTGNWNHDNLDPSSTAWNDLWTTDELETTREETRLLYVAMTRAQDELVIFRSGSNVDRTWESLLSLAEGV